jgi:hypothetical protein
MLVGQLLAAQVTLQCLNDDFCIPRCMMARSGSRTAVLVTATDVATRYNEATATDVAASYAYNELTSVLEDAGEALRAAFTTGSVCPDPGPTDSSGSSSNAGAGTGSGSGSSSSSDVCQPTQHIGAEPARQPALTPIEAALQFEDVALHALAVVENARTLAAAACLHKRTQALELGLKQMQAQAQAQAQTQARQHVEAQIQAAEKRAQKRARARAHARATSRSESRIASQKKARQHGHAPLPQETAPLVRVDLYGFQQGAWRY